MDFWGSPTCTLLWSVVLVLLLVLWHIRARSFPGLCSPKGALPFLGHYHMVRDFMEDPLPIILQYTQEFKAPWCVSMPVERGAVFIHDPADVEYVLKSNFSNYVKGSEFHDRLEELLGEGIFNTDGAKWRDQRKTASHMFKASELRGCMTRQFMEHSERVCEKLDALSESGEPVDMHKLFHQFTLDSICQIAFGLNVNTLQHAGDNSDVLKPEEGLAFAKAFDETQGLLDERFFNVNWRLRKLFGSLLGIPSEVAIARNVATLNDFTKRVIADRRSMSNGELGQRQDLLSLFLRKKETAEQATSDKYLRDVILNFVIAGRDTTAQALSWAFHSLMQPENSAVLAKLRQEVDYHVGENQRVDYEMAKELRYCEAVICETLRLFPSVPKELKYCLKDDVLPSGANIPAGAMVSFIPYVMGRLESLWENPLTFEPDRWLHGDPTMSPVHAHSPFKFTAFQAGNRVCLGKFVALLEAKIITSMLIRRFEFTPVAGRPVSHRASLTLPMKDGLWITVRRRVPQAP